MRRIILLLLAVVLPTIAPAAEDAWASAAVKPGVKVVVMDANGRTHTGPLLEWTAERVALQTATERVEIAREQVALIRAPGPLGNLQTVYAPWENLGQVPSGHAIRVVQATGLPVDGAMSGITEYGVNLTRGCKTVFVHRRDIRKVGILVKNNAETGLKVGATTGAVAGLVTIVAAASQSGGGGDGAGELVALGALGGGKAGEALGRLFDEYQTIYVSRRK